MSLAGWEIRIVKNCDRGLEIAARGRRPRAAYSSPRSDLRRIITCLSFFAGVNWLTSGFVYATFSLNWLTRRQQTIRKKSKRAVQGGGGLWHGSRTEMRGSRITDIKFSFPRITKIRK